VAKYGEILARVGSHKTLEQAGVTDRDLEGLELYILEDILELEGEKRVGKIHVIGDTRELLQVTLKNPDLREGVFLCQSRAHIRRAGYKASKARKGEVTAYRSQKIPMSISDARRISVQRHFGIDDLNLEVRQETDLNVSLGPDIENPSTEWIIIGPAEAIHTYRNSVKPFNYMAGRKEDGCFLIRVRDVVDLEQVEIKADLPKGVASADLLVDTDKSGKEVWRLSLTAEAEQLPQFHEGEYIHLKEAERRYKGAEVK